MAGDGVGRAAENQIGIRDKVLLLYGVRVESAEELLAE